MKNFLALVYVAILLTSVPVLTFAQEPDADTIIQRSAQANDADWKANPQYDWTERDLQSNGGTKTFQELMLFGSPYGRLIEVNGKSLPSAQQQKEQQKLDAEVAKRRSESPDARRHRVAAFEKGRKSDHFLMEQMIKAFNFKLVGEQKLDSHDVYVLDAIPKSGYRPPNMQSQALRGMQGKLWIDKTSFQWVKVEAEVMHPVSIEGVLARVLPGTRFELEKAPVDSGIWLPKHYAMKSRAKVLFVFSHRDRDDETYWNYRKSSEDSAHTGGN